jgi:ubiquinone biosynthesis protein COQ4
MHDKEVSVLTDVLQLPRFDVPRAGRALGKILKNPDDLPQVFEIIEAMSGTAPHRLALGFMHDSKGARILEERRDILPLLADREGLRRLPAGSVGRAYLAFVESEGITPEGIRDASLEQHASIRSPTFAWLNQRMRDTHDLWHTVTGYKGDVLGELSLLAFGLAQHWNTAIAMIVIAGLLKGFGRADTRMVWEAYLRGRAAAWMPAQDWEAFLPLPLEDVRARLRLGAAPVYTPIRSNDLRAAGIV